MQELNFATGRVRYKVNGDSEIEFNPTDTEFSRRVLNIFRDLADKQEAYAKALSADEPDMAKALDDSEAAKQAVAQADAVLDTVVQMDKDMRAAIDGAFQSPGTADAVFGSTSLYAYADGLPLWANFLMAVIDEMPASAEKQAKLTDPRLRKYVGKYSAKYRK